MSAATDQAARAHSPPSRESAEFSSEVRGMFDRIAGVYDLMNTAMTAGMHHRWRERTADRAELSPGDSALDVCCGTGDLAVELRRRVGPSGRVVGCDFSEPMLELARDKVGRGSELSDVEFEWADALDLPYGDALVRRRHGRASGSATSPTSARASRSWPGCLSPGGRLVILEITQPRRPPLSYFHALWFDHIVPMLGAVAGDSAAYCVSARVGARFPPPERARGDDGRRRPRADPLDGARRRASSRSTAACGREAA